MQRTNIKHLITFSRIVFVVVLPTCLFISGCKKFLDKKSDKALAIPSTLRDAQAILDNYTVMNTFYSSVACQSDDDFFLDDAFFNTMATEYQDRYSWQKEVYNSPDWSLLYQIVFYANLALDAVNKIQPDNYNRPEYHNVKGQALFYRAYALYQVAQYWAAPYDSTTADQDTGIPLRLAPDPNKKTTRSTIAETYRQIIADFKDAASLLPVSVPLKARPSRAAAYAALARTYLTMEKYTLAGTYADSCLQLQSALMDYNTINATSSAPFPLFNTEVIMHTLAGGTAMLTRNNWRIDSVLLDSYAPNDLRRTLFFISIGSGDYGFRGDYGGSSSSARFNGLATDEIYLIRAECFARAGNKEAALADLNTLLQTRWKTGTFVPYTAINAADALSEILMERRKELIARGLRWFDLRRLNRDSRFAKTLVRKIEGKTYQLPPDDKRYTFYIPEQVVQMSGIAQNQR